jgi:hypothetical protein
MRYLLLRRVLPVLLFSVNTERDIGSKWFGFSATLNALDVLLCGGGYRCICVYIYLILRGI